MTNIFAIQLDCCKYYVCTGSQAAKIVNDVFTNEWLNYYRHKDFERIWMNYSSDESVINKLVLKFMNEKGIENVRGGKYSNPILTIHELLEIRAEIAKINQDGDNCKICLLKSKNHGMLICIKNLLRTIAV